MRIQENFFATRRKIEFPETARFDCVEGLFNPEIWGIDGQGIHKLIHKAIQASSMDLRREMARSVYLCGGMSRIPGLQARLEHELRQLLPPTLTVKVNCSEYSYHAAFLGAYKFIRQPEYESLLISRAEWARENVNSLRKWRML
jgi:actin beta/gamma 1